MRAGHIARPLRRGGDLVDIQRGGVGQQQRARFHRPVERLEDLALDADLLEHRLDNDIGIRNGLVGLDRLDERESRRHAGLVERAARDAGRVGLPDSLHAPRERLRVLVHDLHGQAGIGAGHGDAAAHRARADHRRCRRRAGGRPARHMRGALRFPLAEKGVAQRLRLFRVLQFLEQRAFLPDALLEGRGAGDLHAADAVPGGLLVAGAAGDLLPHRFEDTRIVLRYFPLRRSRQDRLVHYPHCVGDGGVAQFPAFHQLVQNAKLQRFRSRHMAARDDHLQRGLGADQAGQALRAATGRQDADQDFRQAQLRARHGEAVVAAERVLQAAAQRVAVNRRHDRLGTCLQHVMGPARDRRAPLAEAAYIGAGDEGPAGPDQDHGVHLRVGDAAVHRFQYALAHARPQRVHRRVVHRDDANRTLPGEMDNLGHAVLPSRR